MLEANKTNEALDKIISTIQKSSLFDEDYYLSVYPDVAACGEGPLFHFCRYGARERRSPHVLFDTERYCSFLPAQTIGDNPLLHYVTEGHLKNLSPHLLFDPIYYRKQAKNLEANANPLVHFLRYGAELELDPHPCFSTKFYLQNNPDVKESKINPLVHFLKFGAFENRSPHPIFDVEFYSQNNPDVGRSGVNPLIHYILAGVKERRWPNADFDPVFYKRITGSENPLVHYITEGQSKGLPTRSEQKANQLAQLGQVTEMLLKQERFSEVFDLVKELYSKMQPHFYSQGLSEIGCSEEIDELLLETGRLIFKKGTGLESVRNQKCDEATRAGGYVFIVTNLHNTGGHTAVLEDFLRAIEPGPATILVTEVRVVCDRPMIIDRFQHHRVPIKFAPEGSSNVERLRWIFEQIQTVKPEKIVYLIHPHDLIAVASALPELDSQLYFYHHLCHLFTVGAKIPHAVHIDFHKTAWWNCRQNYGITNNVLLPLCASELESLRLSRVEFMPTGRLKTCSASADPSKVTAPYAYPFHEIIPEVLQFTGGEHVHWGSLPPNVLDMIRSNLVKRGLSPSVFTSVPWVKSIGQAMLELEADLYVNSFPLGGGRSVIEAMAVGMPIMMHSSYCSPFYDGLDIVYPEAYVWRSREELVEILSKISKKDLGHHSALSLAHYQKQHTLMAMKEHLSSLQPPRQGQAVDAVLDGRFTHPTNKFRAFFDSQFLDLPLLASYVERIKSGLQTHSS